MRIRHKVNHGWAPKPRNDPGWERQVEREASLQTDRRQKRIEDAERRLLRSEKRLEAAESRREPLVRVAELRVIVERRRDELRQLQALMTSTSAPSTNRGRGSFRGVPGTRPL